MNRRSGKSEEDEMKVNSISGLICHVADLSRTAEFYEAIGFRRGKEEPDRVTFYVNWFFVTFIARDGAEISNEAELSTGLFTYIKVDDLDEYYEAALAKGMKPAGAPEVGASGNREFVLSDPDGYKLAFFEKK
jgi:catechol 2,3-dioxygenase-like lactoylglutathione lyase family enzyme